MTARLTILLVLVADMALGQTTKPAASNDQGPSLADTLTWIKQTLLTDGKAFVNTTNPQTTAHIFDFERVATADYDGCKLNIQLQGQSIFSQPSVPGPDLRSSSLRSVQIPLQSVDPTSIRVHHQLDPGIEGDAGYWMTLAASNNAAAFAQSLDTTIGVKTTHEDSMVAGVGLPISGQEIGDRVVKALTHAVELCGGKKSLF